MICRGEDEFAVFNIIVHTFNELWGLRRSHGSAEYILGRGRTPSSPRFVIAAAALAAAAQQSVPIDRGGEGALHAARLGIVSSAPSGVLTAGSAAGAPDR